MSVANLYPNSPTNVPEDLTRAKDSYKRQTTLAFVGLLAFIVIYLCLTAVFVYITVQSILFLATTGQFDFGKVFVIFCSGLLALFMIKSLFAVRKMKDPQGIEVFPQDQPELYDYLHKLADEIGAPRPHRVFLTPEVNAAVFYDLSLINLIIPSKKNLIIGMGLVNVLNLSEFKAVLAHEFGHFAQSTMMVGRWVYIAQQIISHMVSVRDWLDGLVNFVSRIDLRIAWVGWILKIVLWSLRSLMEVLFRIVIIAERALSREMEFNADLVAVSVTGSDELVNALYKLQVADRAWRTAMDVAGQATGQKKLINDLFEAQTQALSELRRVYDDPEMGIPPNSTGKPAEHRIFEEKSARPPQMWSTHPVSSDREANAKAVYIRGVKDDRSSWLIFRNAEKIRNDISLGIYNPATTKEFEPAGVGDFIANRFSNISFSPEFRGAYLGRSPVRDFTSVDSMMAMSTVGDTIDLDSLYPEDINVAIKAVSGFAEEVNALEALLSGEFKPSGGVIRHRGEDIKKSEIPDAILEVKADKKHALEELLVHEANCRKTCLNIANGYQQGWPEYMSYTVNLMHAVDHLQAVVSNEMALVINTWNVITADNSIGHFEKKRMIRVCEGASEVMHKVSKHVSNMDLSENMLDKLKINAWETSRPIFDFPGVTKDNFAQWTQKGFESMKGFEHALGVVRSVLLEDLLEKETALKAHHKAGTTPEAAPAPGKYPSGYPILLDGDEYVLQKKLDLWNRFQLAQGGVPTLLRTLVSIGIVGGTIFIGLAAL